MNMEEKKVKKTSGLQEVTQELLGWEDNKLFRTLNHLTTRPGQIVTAYSNGEKSKYLSPVVYFFGVTALVTYIVSTSGLLELMLKSNPIASKLGIDTSKYPEELNNVLSFLFSETGQKIIFLPIVLLLTWLFYRKYNRSFKANSWFALYTAGHAALLSTPIILYWYITKDLVLYSAIGSLVELTYGIWASKQFYNLSIGKAIILRIMMMVTVLLIFIILGGIIGILIDMRS